MSCPGQGRARVGSASLPLSLGQAELLPCLRTESSLLIKAAVGPWIGRGEKNSQRVAFSFLMLV